MLDEIARNSFPHPSEMIVIGAAVAVAGSKLKLFRLELKNKLSTDENTFL